MIYQSFTSRYFDVGCLFLDPDTIEAAGEKECIRTGIEPSPSENQCDGCSFALYNMKVAKSVNETKKRIT